MKNAPWAAAASGWLVLIAGCGLVGNPQPPTLWLPQPVKDLTAVRVGDAVHLHWVMPKNTTDKVALQGDQRAHLCWMDEKPMAPGKPAAAFDAKACKAAGDGRFAPDKPADFTVHLPLELVSGTPRAVSFFVELQNHAGKTAGPSNAAWVATGTAPPAVTALRAETRAEGVLLHWNTAAPEIHLVLRLHRMLVSQPGAPKPSEANGAPPPEQQTLEVNLDKSDPGEALDRDATLDHVWRYTAERVLQLEIDRHALEIAGLPSGIVSVEAKDVFPPRVPAGLAAVADAQAHAIDLSWTPDTEADLAGYVVYRRDLTAGTGIERISPKVPVVPPSFEDRNVVSGHHYAYTVSALDQDGNESARSGEVEEELPQ